jgi:hypothetical protein
VNKKFIKITFDLHCEWNKKPPSYRVFFNGELFAERTYIWKDHYLQELLQVNAEPGHYLVDIENLNPELGSFTVTNQRIEFGPAEWVNKKYVEIKHESQ